jgi:hypothetical protein
VGGDRLDYSRDVATSTSDITTFKILINITLSTRDAAMMMMDIKHYSIDTPLPRFEYMKMLLSRFPEEIVQKYNLNALAVDGWVFIDKLLPLPQPPVRARTDVRTYPSAQRATQLRRVLARVYAVSIQNQITTNVP